MSTAPTIATLRQAIATAITTDLGGDGWIESRVQFDLYGADTDNLLPRSFAIGLPETTFVDPRRRNIVKQANEPGMLVQTRVQVAWALRIRADGQVADYAGALADELLVLQAIASTDPDGIGPIVPERVTRRAAGDGTWLVSVAEYTIRHLYAVAVAA